MSSRIEQVHHLLARAASQLAVDASQSLDDILTAMHLLQANRTDSNADLLGLAYLLAAQACRDLGQPEHCIDYLLLAEETFDALDDRTNLLDVYRLSSFTYTELGYYDKASAYALKRFQLAQKLDDKHSMGVAISHLGIIHSEYGDFEKALYYFEQTIAFAETHAGHTWAAQVALVNMSRTYYRLADYQQALASGMRALPLVRELKDTGGLIDLYGTLTRTHAKLRNWDEAFDFAQQGLSLTQEAGLEYGEARSSLSFGQLHVEHQTPEQSLPYLHRALELAEKNGLTTVRRDTHEALAAAYKTMRQYEQALAHHEKFHHDHTLSFNQQSAQQLHNLEIIHRTKQAQHEIERQKALREQDKQAFERLSKLQQHLVHSASHDLKTPLTSIRLNLDFIARHPDFNPNLQKYLDRIAGSTDKMTSLILNVLDLAKLDAIGVAQQETVNLDAFLFDLVQDYQEYAASNRITFNQSLNTTTAAANTRVKIDPVQMQQAIGNILTNAVKYNKPSGAIFIHSDLVTVGEGEVCITIRDTGIGIPAESLPQIFEPFYRVQSEINQDVEGTGLGLHICYRIIEQHQGTLGVESVVGEGTTFTITLPIAP